jgi:hypothetical protein
LNITERRHQPARAGLYGRLPQGGVWELPRLRPRISRPLAAGDSRSAESAFGLAPFLVCNAGLRARAGGRPKIRNHLDVPNCDGIDPHRR